MSEEQWNDLKFKITIAVILAVVGMTVYVAGPGMKKLVLPRVRAKKADPASPGRYYKIGRFFEATWREKEALEVYKEFYHNYSGDEKQLPGIGVVFEEMNYPHTDVYALIPMWSGGRPAWVGGEGAKPDPLMADVLMRLSKIEEAKRDYIQARLYYRMVLDNSDVFKPGTPAYVQAEAAKKRDVARGF